jgi:hypothetical protein
LDGSKLQSLGFTPRLDSQKAISQAVKDVLSDTELGIV